MMFHHNKMSTGFPAPPPPAPSPFKVDEGYSEDSRSQAGSEQSDMTEPITIDGIDPHSAHHAAAQQWLLSLPVEARHEYAQMLLRSLPNPNVAHLVDEANQRLHFDPVVCLPQEIISHVFRYFDAATLVRASLVSRTWNNRTNDVRLWRRLFSHEGWAINNESVKKLAEVGEKRDAQASPRRPKTRPRSMDVHADSPSVKRVRDADYPTDPAAESPLAWSEQHGTVEADMSSEESSANAGDANMLLRPVQSGDLEMTEADDVAPELQKPRDRLLIQQELGTFKPNWQYLYNQRRRLEQNWLAGRFTNFRLPRVEAQEQAHTQCVYTVQYSNRYVVSGSRDKSVRVWDLHTQELKLPPLEGHTGSVLCLQFDERPDQDVIISGGSDADVIAWRFSTGEIIRRLRKAHTDSVLNLRFDERYLVTCSKDKTIRIWNRKELIPTDPEYPDRGTGNSFRNAQYPDHIVAIPHFNDEDVMIGQPSFEPLPVYSLLMTFDGHAAAVNAIQIFKDEVVSASGDRKIMLWNIKTGTLTRTYTGHTKGIACVQYDGRRIVSGSSDNTVRIFDSHSAAEVAMLEGHRNLVRTVQAEFGDLPGDAELQEAEARDNDARLIRTANTRNPRMLSHAKGWLERYFVYGAKLPPGGGGNRWSKIVSGSYDETVLIWRRDREGRWFIAKELKHEDAMRLASSASTNAPQIRHSDRGPHVAAGTLGIVNNSAVTQQLSHHPSQSAQRNSSRGVNFNTNGREGGEAGSTTPGPPEYPNAEGSSISRFSAPRAASFTTLSQHNPRPQVTPQHAVAHNVAPPHSQQHGTPHPLQTVNAGYQIQQAHRAAPHQTATLAPTANAPNVPAAWPATHQRAQAAQQLQQGPNSRVFKLQFDARRIICCSQEPVIVGWDFANGDEAIMEASEYFGEPS
ncbi:hypothetical protein FH972_021491 [Carpinus fangiana]|uniref:F-box domain-containing protein n=1 Tax=Carpinus fangiana TaxID=176857 RepID=A0A5N6KPG8_9ROSI|nr:hypothetical protein FH972_021491 [Carpinus fangiana]